MKILIVDDHVIFRAGLRQLLVEELPDTDIAEAGDGGSAVRELHHQQWDIILLDIHLPDKSGIEVLKNIRQDNPRQPVLMLSMYSEEQYAVRALRAGASGYLTKETSPDELINAIKQIVAGHKYISQSLAQTMAINLQAADFDSQPHKILSDREYDIFMKLALGKTVSEIAEMVTLSVKTVSTYRARLLKKMNLKNNADLMRYAVLNKLHIDA
jgi:DNA-binding NarL/FixJ family response regulator